MNKRHFFEVIALSMLVACKSGSSQEPAQTGTTGSSQTTGPGSGSDMSGSGTSASGTSASGMGSSGTGTGQSGMTGSSGSMNGGSGSMAGGTTGQGSMGQGSMGQGSMGQGSMGQGSMGSGSGMTGSTGGSGMTGSSGMGTSGSMTDAEIAAIAQTLNQGEVDMGNLATKKAKDAQVKSFAQMMTKEHTAANAKTQTVAKNANITPAQSQTSTQMSSDASTQMSTLQGQSGMEFDKAYMQAQVKMHRDALTMIDQKLMPNAKSPELKAHLTELRGHVQHHLTEAEKIQSKLQGTK